MANKRMFSKQITTSDAFVDMPVSSQLLYFHLNMEADDDGFVANPKRIIKITNVSNDDLKILLSKRFILAFETGVVVIKHWLLHNAVRKDMYKETQYLEEKKTLQIKDNGVYTEVRNESVTEPLHRLDKIRLDKKDFVPKSSSNKTMKKNTWKYNENNSSDSFEDSIDIETGEFIKEKKKIPQNKTAIKLMGIFSQMCEERIKVKPMEKKGSYFLILSALKELTAEQIVELMDDWFNTGKEKADLIQITQCLSPNFINRYKTKNI